MESENEISLRKAIEAEQKKKQRTSRKNKAKRRRNTKIRNFYSEI